VGIFTDNPGSGAFSIGKEYNLPVLLNDIRQFYKDHNQKITNLALREQFDKKTTDLIAPLNPEFLVLAGYVWVTTSPLLQKFQAINAHPADLSVVKDGKRAYAGADGIGAALKSGEKRLYSSVHLVTAEVDGGPILLISRPIHVEEDTSLSSRDRWRKYLKLVNEQSRSLLPLALEKLSCGEFESDEGGNVYYQGSLIPKGHRL
jgi:folate-dependent phosphoribosylglycinamide formyltransferase PurN